MWKQFLLSLARATSTTAIESLLRDSPLVEVKQPTSKPPKVVKKKKKTN